MNVTDGNICVFQDASGSTAIDLHLEWFPNNNIILQKKDLNQNFMYYYSVCRNDVQCGSAPNSTGQIEQSWTNNVCYIVSHFNKQIKPIYNASMGHNGTWIFKYTNGWSFECRNDKDREIEIFWHCNMSTNGEMTKVEEPIPESCVYEMHIDSKWACLGQIPPANNNDGYNFWDEDEIIVISIASTFGIILIVLCTFIWLKRCERRREVKNLMNDILNDDDDTENYGTGTDIDLHDNISDVNICKASISKKAINRHNTTSNNMNRISYKK